MSTLASVGRTRGDCRPARRRRGNARTKSFKSFGESFAVEVLEPRVLLTTFSPTSGGPAIATGVTPTVIDPSTGDIYVATSYEESGTEFRFAVTRFTSSGSLDTSWGTSGTYVLNSFDSGGGDKFDIPQGIALNGHNLAIVGSATSIGWAVAVLDITGNFDAGSLEWQKTTSFESTGQANAVVFDPSDETDGRLFVAGTDGTYIVLFSLDPTDGDLDTSFDYGSGKMRIAIPSCQAGDYPYQSSTAYSMIEASNEDLVLAGTTAVGCCAGYIVGHDYTVVDVEDDYASDEGEVKWTAAFNMGAASSCCTASNDYAYSVAEWDADSRDRYAYTVGTTNYNGYSQWLIARYNIADGSLDTTFGTGGSPTGIQVGRTGIAYGVFVPDAGTSSTGNFVVAGTASNGDFITDGYTGTASGSGDSIPPGSSDTLFGSSGEEQTNIEGSPASTDTSYFVGEETDGSILVVGTHQAYGSSDYDIGLANYAWSS